MRLAKPTLSLLRPALALMLGLLCASGANAQRVFADGFEPASVSGAAEAARFLTQASFGPTRAEIDRLQQVGYETWLDEQWAAPISLQVPYLDFVAAIPEPLYQNARMEAWFRNAVTGPDQLRQRVAYALSQILVVSDANGPLEIEPRALAVYYDLLASHAFGNYRDLLQTISTSPAMGSYLSMRGNRRPDTALNIRPDENFAREILQLFSIGLVQLNADGSPILQAGQPLPSYNQYNIKTFAHVFTGWNFGNCDSFEFCYAGYPIAIGWNQPMRAFADFHHTEPDADPDNSQLLSGVLRPAGGTPESNLALALDNIFNHPNVGPFLSRRLIQQLVTSNPSPAYIARMSAVFNNNGSGVRGDLGALVRALLLDPEARNGHIAQPQRFGKVREPLLRQVHLWRTFSARANNNRYAEWNPEFSFNQAPQRSPSVFNFYLPDYQRPGELSQLGLFAPELQIVNEVFVTRTANTLYHLSERRWLGSPYSPSPQAGDVMMDFSALWPLAQVPAGLLDELNLLLMSGQMSAHMRGVLLAYLEAIPYSAGNDPGGRQRSWEAVHLIVTSPEYQVQK